MSRPALPVRERFWSKVDSSGGPTACWIWKGTRNPYGYGTFMTSRNVMAHRVSWGLWMGEPPPSNLFVCHRCDNRPCVNPAHLFLGTAADNNWDMVRKGRWRGGSKPGSLHPSSKLTFETATAARQMWSDGRPVRAIAAELGVSVPTIYRVLRRQAWKYAA